MSRYVARLIRSDVLALTSLLWFMMLFLRYVLPPLFETFQKQFAIGTVELGVTYSALLFTYSAMQFPAGWLADRIGRVQVITGGGILFSIAAVVVAVSESWSVLVTGMLLLGVGTGGHKTIAIPLLSVLYDESMGRTLGTMDMIGQFGGVAAPSAVVALDLVDTDWRALFALAAAVSLVLVGAFYRRSRQRFDSVVRAEVSGDGRDSASTGATGTNNATEDTEYTYLTLFLRPRFLLFVGVSMLISLAWGGFTAFFPLYLTTATGFSSNVANLLFDVLFAASLTQPLVGELSDRFEQMVVMTLTLVGATVAAVGLLLSTTPVTAGLCLVGLGVGMHGFRPVRDSYLSDVIPDAITGGTLGIARTVMILSGSVAPAAVSLIIDSIGYVAAFIGLSVAVLVATALIGVLLMTE